MSAAQGAAAVRVLLQQAAAQRQAQRMEEALAAAAEAARLASADAQAAFAFAQLSFETWRPAADAFGRARRLAPPHPDLVRNHALALAAEGDLAAAEQLLEATLVQEPRWLDGHRTLAALRITHGETGSSHDAAGGGIGEGFDRSYAAACLAQPAHTSLWLAWFQQYATQKRWSEARHLLEAAKKAIPGAVRGLDMAMLFLEAETDGLGDDEQASVRFAPFDALRDPGLDICQVRYWLRAGRPVEAAAIAERHLGSSAARLFWPYAALAWRLLGDQRAAWLDGRPLYSTAVDLAFTEEELAVLAEVLRGLHRLSAPYPEQSVRGGTQTDRQLFFHPHPAIQAVRAKVAAAVAQFAASLPEAEAPPAHPPHPLLGLAGGMEKHNAESLRFEGSWSVRLAGAGFHASHTHHLGWISSALYVALPTPAAMGRAPAGWLGLGTPPPELGLSLRSYQHVEPKPGRLALFPSTLWHNTEPFGAGERLTIAFDVRLPSP